MITGSGLSNEAFSAFLYTLNWRERYRMTDEMKHEWRKLWERQYLDSHPEAWYAAEVQRMKERAPA